MWYLISIEFHLTYYDRHRVMNYIVNNERKTKCNWDSHYTSGKQETLRWTENIVFSSEMEHYIVLLVLQTGATY